MATAIDTPLSPVRPPVILDRGEAPQPRQRATAVPLAPGEERAASWGDSFSVQVWFACCVLMWLVLVADFLFGMAWR
jgi:hypothetical protein